MKKKISNLGLLGIIGVSIILFLYKGYIKRRDQPTHFTRRFAANIIHSAGYLDITYNSYYIAGAVANKIYLANWTAPLYLLSIDSSMEHNNQIAITNATGKKISSGHIILDSSYIYLADEVSRSLYRGSIKKSTVDQCFNLGVFADLVIPLSPNTFILRTIKPKVLEYNIEKISSFSMPIIPLTKLLEKQVDGIFSCDGSMNFDRANSQLVYIYFYRNQYICMDTNLNLLYRGKTIDTTTWAKINLATIKSQNVITNADPPQIVNKGSCIFHNFLFIIAGLKADNERRDDFDKASVVDVYDLRNGVYKFSFYIPDYQNKKISSFTIFKNHLFAVSNHYFISYKLEKRGKTKDKKRGGNREGKDRGRKTTKKRK